MAVLYGHITPLDPHTIGAAQEQSKHFSNISRTATRQAVYRRVGTTSMHTSNHPKLNHPKPPHGDPSGSIWHKADLVEADQKRNKQTLLLLVHCARVAHPLCLSPLFVLARGLTLARVQDARRAVSRARKQGGAP